MKLRLMRIATSQESTLGALYADGRFLCFTLEDEHRDVKVPGETRIPGGTYRITLRTEGGFHSRFSNRFRKMHRGMLWLRDVPGFEWVLIHTGNKAEDTAGCLLVGDLASYHPLASTLERSTAAYVRIYPELAEAAAKRDLSIDVEDIA